MREVLKMVALPENSLVKAFLTDHQTFMKLLYQVSAALNAGDVTRAKELGRELDRVAGPHIAFEESVLYPAIDDQTRDRSFVPQLFREHQAIVEALFQLLHTSVIESDELMRLRAAFDEGLGHAEHCGTLISRLSSLDERRQREALAQLRRLQKSNLTWTGMRKEE